MASIELSKNKDMSPYDQLLSLPSPSTLDPNMSYQQQQQQDLSSPESGISSSQSSKDESTVAIGTANQLRDTIRVVAPPSTPVVSSSEDKIKNILSMFPYDRQSSQTNVRPLEFGSTIAPIGSIYSHTGSASSSTDEISLNRPPELGQLNIQPPRSPLQSAHYLPSQFIVSPLTTSPLPAKPSTQVQLAPLPSVDEKQPQQHSGITEHRYQELLQSHQNFEQQTREMFEKMQNSLGKMMTFMESVDSRLSNLERLSSAILANQANHVTVVSSPLIPEPTTADFEAAKQMELFEQDRILAEKLQAEEKHEKEQEKGKKGKPDLPKKEKDFLPSSATLPASATPQVQVSSCPICNKQVISSELELHVNECLDADKKATATTPTPLASTAQQEKDKSLWHKFWSPSTPVPTATPTPTPTPTPAPQPQPQSQSQPQASHNSLYPTTSSSLPQRLPAPVASTTITNSSAATNYPPPPYAIPQQLNPYYSQPVYRQTGYPPYPYSQYPGNMMQPMMPIPPNGTAQNGPYLYYATQQPVSQPNNSLQQPKN